MRRFRQELDLVAAVVDVPGTPRSVRLENVERVTGGVRLSWSFVDPNVLPGESTGHGRRIRGRLEVASADAGRASDAWAVVQLAAAREYKRQIDADWEPGEPYVRRTWTAEQAWDALVSHLRSGRGEVAVTAGEIRVTGEGEEAVYRIDPAQWAIHLTEPADAWGADSDIVPVGTRMHGGLPLWAVDELDEALGAGGPVVTLVDGRIVGSR